MKKIDTYIWPWFKRILNWWHIRDRSVILNTKLFTIIQKWIIQYNGYFVFDSFKERFDWDCNISDNEKIYQEFSMNKFYIDDYIDNHMKPSLRYRACLWKIIVDTISLWLLEHFPNQSFIVVAIMDKQKTSFVPITFYSIFQGYTPILEEPFSETEKNYLYVSKIMQ